MTIISQEKVSLEEGFTILRIILSLRGYTLLEDEKLIKVVPLEKARGEGLWLWAICLQKGQATI